MRFEVRAELASATTCNCSICSKKGFIHLIVERSGFQLLTGADALVSYRFNTGVAEHKFCGQCGIHPFYTPRSDPDKVDVNVRCLDGVDLTRLELLLFDGKHWEEAIKTAHWQAE
ncbi:MAG TPA: GFA family protein [Polyangiaceae bacterium]|nr:GFA family protein [Polyangiaceae bacterium]